MTTVAFLQNMWVREPERARESFAMYGERWWRRATYQFLFGGCVTGRRLRAAFGDLCERIIWEESTLEICGDPKTIPDPQPDHIRAVLAKTQPLAVLTFGRIAGDAVAPLWSGLLIRAPHPAARQPDVVQKLRAAATSLRAAIDAAADQAMRQPEA